MPSKEELAATKMANSAPYFKKTAVLDCAKVIMKGDKAVAVPFPQKLTGYKAKNSYVNQVKSSETEGVSKSVYKPVPGMHVGMVKKPLVKYDPNSYRNRLQQPTVVMPLKNSSQVVLGNPEQPYKRQFVSMNKNHFASPSFTGVTNPGIIAERTKWVHKYQGM